LAQDERIRETSKLGPFLATVLIASTMIGSGVFLLPATLAAVGGMTIVSWLVCAVGALLLAGTFAALAMIRPEPEGIVGYARGALGDYFGFQAGLAYWVSCWLGNVAIALAVVGYLAHFAPVLAESVPSVAAAIAVTWLITAVALVGPRFLAKFGGLTLVLGLIPILAVAFLGWLWFDPKLYLASWNTSGQPALTGMGAAVVSVFWAFTGVEVCTVSASVVRNPARNIPIAVIGGVSLTALLYILACTVIMGVVPAAALARSSAPFALAAGQMFGALAAGGVAVCVVLKASGTFGGCTLMTAETTRASADLGYFPRFLGGVRGNGAPAPALIAMAVICSAALILTRSNLTRQFSLMIDASVVLTVLGYGYCCIALLRLAGGVADRRGRLVARLCGSLGLLFCIAVIAGAGARLLVANALFLVATVPLWALFLLARRMAAAREAEA
jgi:arginine:agmatine antiporter